MRFLFAISGFLVTLLLFFTDNSIAQKNNLTPNCPPSSCGNVRNIRFPFRLKSDPRTCGDDNPNFELDCQNNRAILNVTSRMYFVQDINYLNFTIRLVDPGIKRGHLSSCPTYSIGYYDLELEETAFKNILDLNIAVVFIRCLSPASSAKYVKAAFCGDKKSSFYSNFSEIHGYIMPVENEQILELKDFCAIASVGWVSKQRPMRDNSSLTSIYDGLAYGFELSWDDDFCRNCSGPYSWCIKEGNAYNCHRKCQAHLLIQEGFKCTLIEIWKSDIANYCRIAIGALLGLRFVCGFTFLVTLVVKKWRKRYLSVDETIEEFLQGQNNLTPIKYSYSEIKKMTNNFNQRLGEGGFGTVYKGIVSSIY